MVKKNNYNFNLRKLCTPASIYFVLSIISFVILLVQNLGGNNLLCVGDYKCDIGNVFLTFVFNLVYIIFWTFILDMMCKNGYEKISWLLVLLPILLMFIMLSIIVLYYRV